MSRRDKTALIVYQNPAEDGKHGPTPDGPMGWRVYVNPAEVNNISGGEVIADPNFDDEPLNQAVELALSDGAGTLRFKCGAMDADAMRAVAGRVPALKAFVDGGGTLFLGTEEIRLEEAE